MIKKKICIITGSRAEYGLLYWLIKEIKNDKDFELQLIVTGMHLSSDFGLTYKEIQKSFKITKKIHMPLFKDSSVGIVGSMCKAQNSFSYAYKNLKPDIIILLGDRYEILSAAIPALISKIPIAHIHGGEASEGSWDESIRHAITKMAHLHFTSTENYKKKVIQLGEAPTKVFNVGGMGVENIKRLKLLSKNEIEKSIKFKFNKHNLLVTFHPVTLENDTSKKQFQEILNAINELVDTNIIFTKANSDLNGRIINKMIDKYVNKNTSKSISFFSLGQLRYLSVLQFVDAVVGNSSSGLTEAPSFKIATINIGDRQKGRIKAKSVIDCLPIKKKIKESIAKIYSKNFKRLLKITKNPYDNGIPSKKIIKILKKVKFESILMKKFYNIKFDYERY